MYRTAQISASELQQIHILNQEQIEDLTGSKLNLVGVHEAIRTESNGFSTPSPKAQEADQLLASLLEKRGVGLPAAEPSSNTNADDRRKRDQQRAKAQQQELELLALQLELES